jgi:DNA-binding HxlR family transcriptional regulator
VKDLIDKLNNKFFESRVRLGVMAMLMVEDWVHYSHIKQSLELTDGNLATHLKLLRNHELIEEKKEFVNRKPHTTYRATEIGRKEFQGYLDALEALIHWQQGNHGQG